MKRKIFDIIQIGDKSNRISRAFDFFIVLTIILNISVMFLDTFDNLSNFRTFFKCIEIITTIIFLIEYILRIWTAEYLYPNLSKFKAKLKFLYSFDGIIDLLTIIPAFFLTGFIVFRMLRVVRIFHLFRINAQYDSFHVITTVLNEKKNQLVSSIFIILILMFASSLCMYSAEHEVQPDVFENAFSGIWWSVSTILTVGYGYIYPITILGRIMAIIIAFLGVGVVAIPTGIISAGFVEQYTKIKNISDVNNEYPINFITLYISEKHNWKNLCVKDTNIPQGLLLLCILKNNDIIIPTGETKILLGDTLILVAESYIDDTQHIHFKELLVNQNNSWVNKSISDLDISRLTTIIAIKRKHKIIIPHGNTIIKDGDTLLMYSKR